MGIIESEVMTKVDVDEECRKLKLKPVFSRIVIKEVEIEKVGALFIPETAKQGGELQTNEGYILAVGEEVESFKRGDRIYYGRYSGFWCRIKGEKYRIMNEEDIIGVF